MVGDHGAESEKADKDQSLTSGAENTELERYRIRFGFYKVIAGTALVGALGIIVPGAIEFWQGYFEDRRKTKELEIAAAQRQQEYVQSFITTALNQDIELRLRFTQYFSSVLPDKQSAGWGKLYEVLKEDRDKTREEIHARERRIWKLLGIKDPDVDQQIEIAQLRRELDWRYKEIGYVQHERTIIPTTRQAGRNTDRPRVYQSPLLVKAAEKAIETLATHDLSSQERAKATLLNLYNNLVNTLVIFLNPNNTSKNIGALQGNAHEHLDVTFKFLLREYDISFDRALSILSLFTSLAEDEIPSILRRMIDNSLNAIGRAQYGKGE